MIAMIKGSFLAKIMPGRFKLTRHGPIRIVIIMVIILGLFFFIPINRNLVIEAKNGNMLYWSKIKTGAIFTISYVHSVNNSPVEEIFEIQADDSLLLIKTAFASFGAGIPSELQPGQEIHYLKDRIEISKINLKLPEILLFVGTVADHQLTVQHQKLSFNSLTQPQQTVRILVRRVSLYDLLRRD